MTWRAMGGVRNWKAFQVLSSWAFYPMSAFSLTLTGCHFNSIFSHLGASLAFAYDLVSLSRLFPEHTPESSPLFCLIHYHRTCGVKPFTLVNFLDHLPGYSWAAQEWPFKWVQGCLSSISWCCFFLRRLWVGQLSHLDFQRNDDDQCGLWSVSSDSRAMRWCANLDYFFCPEKLEFNFHFYFLLTIGTLCKTLPLMDLDFPNRRNRRK